MNMKKSIALILVFLLVFAALPLSASAANETEPNENYQTATVIALNANIYGALDNSTDEDWYKFTLTEKGSVQISFKHENINESNIRWEMYLYSSDGSTHIDGGNGFWSIPGNKDVTTGEIGLDAGTYYIRIKHWNSNWVVSSTYTVRASFTASAKYETEINNSPSTADEIDNNVFVYGSISSEGDEDWYKFTLTEKGYISIWFAHPKAEDNNTRWEVYLYREDASTSVDGGKCYWAIPGDQNVQTGEIGVEAGTYYVKVKAWNDSWVVDSTYTLDVYFTASDKYESEQNNTYQKADTLSLFGEANGSISTSTDVDWYKVTVPQNGKFRLSFTHPIGIESNSRWTVYLYRNDAYSQIQKWNIPETLNLNNESIDLSAGTYFIKVTAWNDSWVVDTTYTLSATLDHTCDGEWEIVDEPTCEKTGSKEKYCDICKKLIAKETIPQNEHFCEDWTIVTESDCKNEGLKTGICEFCDKPFEKKIPTTDHSHKTVVTPPTCTEKGYTTYTCECGDTYVSDYIVEDGHKDGEWVVVNEPEIGKPGKREKRCSVCNELLAQEDIDALAPTYVIGDVNGNGDVEKYDYIAVKRAVMGTLSLDETQQKAADVNGASGVEKYDYILIKRHVMGTFTIGK